MLCTNEFNYFVMGVPTICGTIGEKNPIRSTVEPIGCSSRNKP